MSKGKPKGKKNKGKKPIPYDKQARKAAKQNNHPPARRTTAKPANTPQSAPSRIVSLAPLAPLVIRSARPFDGQAGVDAARFPPPSTLAGCLRTAWSRADGKSFGEEPLHKDIDELLKEEIKGPLLLRGDTLLLPKPADALYFGHGDEADCVRASPKPLEAGCGCDLPMVLLPVQLEKEIKGKPGKGPQWWAFEDWLRFRQGQTVHPGHLAEHGWLPPPGDRRTHVAIDSQHGVAEEGKLFQTEGLDLSAAPESNADLRILAKFSQPLGAALVHLGGKRRLAAMEPQPDTRWPQAPKDWWQQIQQKGGLSLTLVTPALFTNGYRPGWLNQGPIGTPPGVKGLRLRLQSVAVERWQPQSGWDLAKQQPRANRKLAPAGAVYWFAIEQCDDPKSLEPLWLGSLCDDPQDRRDGFGLALPAPWSPITD